MKLARWLLATALLFAMALPASGQMPSYNAPGFTGPAQRVAFNDPVADVGAEQIGGAPMPPGAGGPMAPGPVYSDQMPGAAGAMNGGYMGGNYGPPGGDAFCPPLGPVAAERRVCMGYVSMDAMYWTRIQNAPSGIATLAGTGAAALRGGAIQWDPRVVPRLTAGYILDRGLAIEGTYFYIDNFSGFAAANSANNVNGFRPIGVFAGADSILLEGMAKLQSGEVNLIETNHFINFLVGFRWIEFRDRARITATNLPLIGSYNLDSYNKLFGAQAGLRSGYDWGLFGIQALGKGGLFYNDAHNFTTVTDVDPTVNGTMRSGGQTETFVGEVQVVATYRPIAAMQVRLGYNAMWITQVAVATDQVLPPPNAADTGRFLNQRSDLFFHGPFAGLEYRW
jgi:hypothetical protein